MFSKASHHIQSGLELGEADAAGEHATSREVHKYASNKVLSGRAQKVDTTVNDTSNHFSFKCLLKVYSCAPNTMCYSVIMVLAHRDSTRVLLSWAHCSNHAVPDGAAEKEVYS